MTTVSLCRVPKCNTPAASRSTRDWPLCEKHQKQLEGVDSRWGWKAANAIKRAPAPVAFRDEEFVRDSGRRT